MLLRCCVCVLLATFVVQAQQGRGGRGGVLGQASGPQAPPPPSDCAASGTVVNALTGEPIPRATVTLGGGNGGGSSTDGTGRWSITNTPCGTRIPNASRPGFIPVNQVLQAVSARPKPVELVSGTPVNNIKISLMPGGIITGSVRDVNGDPVESAQIRIMRVNVQQGKRTLLQQGGSSTDLDGNFRIGNLMPGHYVICADSGQITYPVGGGDALVYRESCFPGPIATGLSNSMAVTAGQEVRTSFTLSAARGVRVRGMITGAPTPQTPANPNANPPPANVQLMQFPNGGGGGRGGRVMRDGSFEITGVQPGSYIVRATVPGVAQPGPPPSAQMQIEVGGSDLDNLVLAFQTPGSIEGFVRYELSQAAQAAGANPNVNVNLTTATPGTPFFGPIPQAKWDTGHINFTFAEVPAGTFRLNANVNGGNPNGNGAIGGPLAVNGYALVNAGGTPVAGAYIKSATLRGQDVLNQGFSVEGKAGPIEVVVSDDVGEVDATVTDPDGKPVAASVILLSKSGQRRILSSGDDGHASAKNIPAGEYKAWAFDSINSVPYAEDEWMSRNAGPGETVAVASAGSANISLKLKAVPPE